MADTDLTPAPQVWPTLRARDAKAMIEFLVDAFGFEATSVMADGDHIAHAELAWPPGGGIMLGSARSEGPDLWALEPGTFGAYAVTDDPDAIFARAVARGATVLQEPSDTPYGSRECALRDREGNRWSFGTYRGAPRSSARST
jgi:uncharacterized glyoxalase superfamily protein PhnB